MTDAIARENTETGKLSLANGDRDFEAGDIDSALRHYKSASQIFRDNGDKCLEGLALLRLTYVYEQRTLFSEARKLALEAMEIFEKCGDKVLANDAKGRLATLEKM